MNFCMLQEQDPHMAGMIRNKVAIGKSPDKLESDHGR